MTGYDGMAGFRTPSRKFLHHRNLVIGSSVLGAPWRRTASGTDNPPFQGPVPPKQRNHAGVVEIHGNEEDLTGSLSYLKASMLSFRASTVTIREEGGPWLSRGL